MPINKGQRFRESDIFIDYPFEEVMFRWECNLEKIYRKFYGSDEEIESIPHDNNLYNEALRFGDEITYDKYIMGKLADE